MSKVMTFSRMFPSYHPRKGEPTYFVEKILASLGQSLADEYRLFNPRLSLDSFEPKHHTIRSGHRFKAGDLFSPRVWSGNSKQIIIAPDIQVKKVFSFQICPFDGSYLVNTGSISTDDLKILAINDGFEYLDDFELWFKIKKRCGFSGQIICWNENIEYQ
jgi:hypothetical protein